MPIKALGQDKNSPQALISHNPIDTLHLDSIHHIEFAPLDIPKDRGIFILTPDKEMQMRILGSVRLLVVYDNLELNNKNSMITTSIPTGELNVPLPNYFNGLEQTRLGFEVTRSTPRGNLFARLETDFAGTTGFRIRHAYGQFHSFLIGQTWSLFSQINALPSTVDFSGPTGSVVQRTPQIRFSSKKPILGANFAVGLEYILPDYSIPDTISVETFQLIPDITFRFDKTYEKVYWQLSGIVPILSAREENGDLIVKPGWGIAASAYVVPWNNGRWYILGVTGQAIARLISDISGNGLDVLISPDGSKLVPLSWGGYIGYEHLWNKRVTTNLFYGLIGTETVSFTPDNTFSRGFSWRMNLFWQPVEGSKLGIEGIWGNRLDKNEASGDACRLNALFYYDF